MQEVNKSLTFNVAPDNESFDFNISKLINNDYHISNHNIK